MDFKEGVKKYQGKYFLGYEICDAETYVFVKKIMRNHPLSDSCFTTYSNVICNYGDHIEFEQNRRWFFGEYHINKYKYKEITKSQFMSALKKYGFKEPDKKDEAYQSKVVLVEGNEHARFVQIKGAEEKISGKIFL